MKLVNKSFNESELVRLPIQYAVSHESPLCFQIGEKVFLKSNPEVVLVVEDVTLSSVFVKVEKTGQILDFPPQCLLQYRYAGLKTFKDVPICEN